MTPTFLTLFVAAATIGATAPAGPPEGVFDPPPIVRHQLEEGATKRAAYEAAQRRLGEQAKSWASELPPPSFDVLSYELDLDVDPDRRVLSGSVTAEIEAVEQGLSTVVFDADLALRILSVIQLEDRTLPYDTPGELAFGHDENRLTIELRRPLDVGEAIRLQITYGGQAWRPGLIGGTGVNWYFNGSTPVIHTFAQPYGARVWWPCNDRPDDKAIVTLRVTVPADLDVASNGLETSWVANDDGTATSVWASKYAVPTYLVVMHISDFVYSESTYTALDGTTTMPVGLWAMPGVASQAEDDLSVTVPQIGVMAEHWGEYPFLDEKYGNATVYFGGGMEHQTMTTLSVFQVGNAWMEWLNVHELGHQWWGDWVTMDDWRDIWLNEGYATHTEWLWAEHLGPDVLAQYLEDEDWRGWFSGSVYDNPEPFSWTIYSKGAWVVWMLRHVVGDDVFFDAMAAYRAANAGATGTSDELQAALEAASGMELDWFFDQWVYGQYRPRYIYSWENTTGPALDLTVRQVQTNTGLFRMPVDVRVTTAAGGEDHVVWLEAEVEQTVTIPLDAAATGVELDPDSRILAEIAHVSEPDLELGPDFPDGYDFGLVAGSGQAVKTLPLTNTGGADLVVEGIWADDGGNFSIEDPPAYPLTIGPGETVDVDIVFDPSGYGPKGDYFYIQSNDPDRAGGAYVLLRGVAALYEEARLVAPSSRSFGNVPVGGTNENVLELLNIGGEPIAIQTAVEGDGFSLGTNVPAALPPGSATDVFIRFQPIAEGEVEGSLVIHAGDPAAPLATVRLIGTGLAAPRLAIDPSALPLGVGTGDQMATVKLSNTGGDLLEVALIEAQPPFSLREDPDLPLSIPPGASRPIAVGIETDTDGTATGHLTIHSNDPAIPVARVPVNAHVGSTDVVESSFPAAASGAGVGDAVWSSRGYLVNPTDGALQTDLIFRPGGERGTDGPDTGFELPARSQRVIPNLVGATGASGTGGVNLRSSGRGGLAVSRTFASGTAGTYGQLIPAIDHSDAITGEAVSLFAGLAGNDGFRTNIGVLNLGDEVLTVELAFFDSTGTPIGVRRITAQPGAFSQVVAVISKLTDAVIRGGYATAKASGSGARYLTYGSVVDDGSNDPTLVLPQPVAGGADATDLVIPTAAALPGLFDTLWRSQLDVVNMADEQRSITVTYFRADGSDIASMPMFLEPGETLHFDDVVGGLFGEAGKGWLQVSASGAGVHSTSRTYNDDPDGTYGQLVPAVPIASAATAGATAVLPGLSSGDGFRTNIGLTSSAAVETVCTVTVYTNDGATLGEIDATIPANGFIQLERVLGESLDYQGEAWAEISSTDPLAELFAHASVIDERTGDPTYISAAVVATAASD